MSILPDHEIEMFALRDGMIDDMPLGQLQPASFDVRLDNIVLVPHLRGSEVIDLGKPSRSDSYDAVLISDGYMLTPGHFVLASTVEYFRFPADIVGRLEGKSSLARRGLQVHSAGFFDPGFQGNATLEIVNFGVRPIILRPGVLIAQMSFEYLHSKCRQPYQGRYQGSRGVVGPIVADLTSSGLGY